MMQSILKLASAAVVASLLAQTNASAHAFLDHAIPSVGGVVAGSPREIRLYFTTGVVAAFSGVRITSEAGTTIHSGKAIVDPSNRSVVIVRLGRALPPGSYTVSWHVVSVDTHPTQGTFRFTVT